ncbi:MAG: DNA-directed RNA polymerase subunit alpha [Candidatus Woesebacteria bacterium]|nr:MAG: DNA-directed RNA polymerase subunit alpha [Candidatus Woesebacteria bacterium]
MNNLFEIKEELKKDNYTKFVLTPLVSGYGYTLAVALRRVLLGNLPGGAITKVEIEGVRHQFSSLKGMKEDVLDFLLNLKKVRISLDSDKPVKMSLSISKQGEVKAGDIKCPAGVKIANPDLVLANLSKSANLQAQMEAEKGVGYLLAEERPKESIGSIPLDASFSPVLVVNYKVEETRVGRLTNFDKLTLEITTDGTMSPKDALLEASKILVSYFHQIISPQKIEVKKTDEKVDELGSTGKLSVEEIGLPTRVANALTKAGYDTVERLVNAPQEDLMKVRNLGEKSLKIISVALMEKGVKFNS